MSPKRALWAFKPKEERSTGENADWWQTCYVAGQADATVRGYRHWQLITGRSGSGKSVLLDALERDASDALILHYDPSLFPGGPKAWNPKFSHLEQIAAHVMLHFRQQFSVDPAKLDALSPTDREFLRWLIERFDSPRAFERWTDLLPPEKRRPYKRTSKEDVYSSLTEWRDIQGLIQDLSVVAQALDYRRLLVLVDAGTSPTTKDVAGLRDLFGWLEPMQHPGLALVASVPLEVYEKENLLDLSRGRVKVTTLEWTPRQVREMVERHVRATAPAILALNHLITPAAWVEVEKMVMNEWKEAVPRGWVWLAKTLVEFAGDEPDKLPFRPQHVSEIRRRYYAAYLKLRVDTRPEHQGVWRGREFIRLDEQPFRFLKTMWENENKSATLDDLRKIAGSEHNVHTLARRLRQVIEPDPNESVYIKSKRNEGYWLENCE